MYNTQDYVFFFYLILHNQNNLNNHPGKQKSVLTGTTLSRDLEEQKQHDRLKEGTSSLTKLRFMIIDMNIYF